MHKLAVKYFHYYMNLSSLLFFTCNAITSTNITFWTLSIVLSLSKNTVLFIFSKHSVSETAFCLRLQVKPTQFRIYLQLLVLIRKYHILLFHHSQLMLCNLVPVVYHPTCNNIGI
jgi:hypothetical protein